MFYIVGKKGFYGKITDTDGNTCYGFSQNIKNPLMWKKESTAAKHMCYWAIELDNNCEIKQTVS